MQEDSNYMTITKEAKDNTLVVKVEGRIDTNTSPDLEMELKSSLDGVQDLIFDFKDVDYISSAGLRVLLSAQKTMNKQGSMKLINVRNEIMEIFEVTGFTDILTIE
jgi:anti-sigma B factor antagonist